MVYKEVLAAIAIALTFAAFVPYIRSILNGKTKPHVFSWMIWGSVTLVVFLAQLADGGGAGAWPIGVSGLITLYVALLAYRRKSDSSITQADWWFFIIAMASLPLWYVTSNPLWTVILLTTIDILGFGPTFRKVYMHPFEEQRLFFIIIAARNLISIFALAKYLVTTALFPAATGMASIAIVILITVRRRMLLQYD